MRGLVPAFGTAAILAGCTTGRWERLQAEFPEVRANCGLARVQLLRDRRDPGLLWLLFQQRHAIEVATRRDGRLACVEHWARERGYRLDTAGAEGPPR
jgi:hypothetical protein